MIEKEAVPRVVRCKFQVEKVAKTAWGSEEVTLKAVDGDSPEAGFANSMRPRGMIDFEVTAADLKGAYEPGQCYWMQLTPCEEAPSTSLRISSFKYLEADV